MLDLQHLIGEVAAKNGIRLEPNDPAFAIGTLNQLVLEETVAGLIENVSSILMQFAESLSKTERRAGAMLAQDARNAATEIKAMLLAESQPQTRPTLATSTHLKIFEYKWFALGLLSATLLLGAGTALGTLFAGR